MAENNKEDIIEESKDSDVEAAKKGLTTALLIKIVIGLTVLLIVLAIALFFFKNSKPENTEMENTEQEMSQNQDSQVEVPDTATEKDTEDNSAIPSAEKVLVQMLELQQRITELENENQNLTESINILNKKNNDLKSEIQVFTKEMNSSEIPLDQLVNTDEQPHEYRRENYSSTPEFGLEPKWGEFETSATAKK